MPDRPTCGTCRFFERDSLPPLHCTDGVCHRYPPQRVEYKGVRDGEAYTDVEGQWAPTEEDGWCGEYEPLPPEEGISKRAAKTADDCPGCGVPYKPGETMEHLEGCIVNAWRTGQPLSASQLSELDRIRELQLWYRLNQPR